MYATITIHRDDRLQRLCFRSRADAQRFQDLARLYRFESGATSGVSAYWLRDLDINLCKKPPKDSTTRIDQARLEKMLDDILENRTASRPPTVKVEMAVKVVQKGIVFTLGVLPPRQRPTVGDMCMLIRDQGPFNVQEEQFECIRYGRVEADNGDSLVVTEDGADADDLRYTVRPEVVMKIYDWGSPR